MKIKILDKIYTWLHKKLFTKLFENSIKIKPASMEIEGKIDTTRCEIAYNFINDSMKEINSDLDKKCHLYIIQIQKSTNDIIFTVIDNNMSKVCEVYDNFSWDLYEMLISKINNTEISNIIKTREVILDIALNETIDPLIEQLIIHINKKNKKNVIYDKQYYYFSKIKVGMERLDKNIEFIRFYGIGIDKINDNLEESLSRFNTVFENLLSESIGYIESPTEKGVLDSYKILDEYANQILQRYNVIPNVELINEIATATYEGEDCIGSMVFLPEDEKIDMNVEFVEERKLKLKFLRIIRKYLEMSKYEYSLLVKKSTSKENKPEYSICGLVKVDSLKEIRNYTILRFNGYRKWKIESKELVLLERKGEKYHIPNIATINVKIDDILKQFLNNDDITIEKINKIIDFAKKQPHGTMLILTYPDEAEKLSEHFYKNRRAIKIKNTDENLFENPSIILNLSAIDGAIIIDTQGKCHAIGVILDGISSNVRCKISRGARYNSAVTFIFTNPFKEIYGIEHDKCKIFVFSEDKTVNILPDDHKEDIEEDNEDQ